MRPALLCTRVRCPGSAIAFSSEKAPDPLSSGARSLTSTTGANAKGPGRPGKRAPFAAA